ncbi:MAG: Rpn family recombination-promoting nuclease/putative transposase [Magnetococcales bacterium]|nr:Rpn family recombination-promoting nuclease/putative transposase [Magnetococcales bacterium]
MSDHDGLYHQLYAHPAMMADLLREFVAEPWVADFDLDRMEPVKTKFHIPGLPKRTGDIIWRASTRAGSDIYLTRRVHAADQETLEVWGDRVLEAKTLDEVFAKQSSGDASP